MLSLGPVFYLRRSAGTNRVPDRLNPAQLHFLINYKAANEMDAAQPRNGAWPAIKAPTQHRAPILSARGFPEVLKKRCSFRLRAQAERAGNRLKPYRRKCQRATKLSVATVSMAIAQQKPRRHPSVTGGADGRLSALALSPCIATGIVMQRGACSGNGKGSSRELSSIRPDIANPFPP
jgi:hypothetical protein